MINADTFATLLLSHLEDYDISVQEIAPLGQGRANVLAHSGAFVAQILSRRQAMLEHEVATWVSRRGFRRVRRFERTRYDEPFLSWSVNPATHKEQVLVLYAVDRGARKIMDADIASGAASQLFQLHQELIESEISQAICRTEGPAALTIDQQPLLHQFMERSLQSLSAERRLVEGKANQDDIAQFKDWVGQALDVALDVSRLIHHAPIGDKSQQVLFGIDQWHQLRHVRDDIYSFWPNRMVTRGNGLEETARLAASMLRHTDADVARAFLQRYVESQGWSVEQWHEICWHAAFPFHAQRVIRLYRSARWGELRQQIEVDTSSYFKQASRMLTFEGEG